MVQWFQSLQVYNLYANCKLLARRFYTVTHSTNNKILLFLEPQNRQTCFSFWGLRLPDPVPGLWPWTPLQGLPSPSPLTFCIPIFNFLDLPLVLSSSSCLISHVLTSIVRLWLHVLQLDMYNRTLMEFADRESDFGPRISSHGLWVNSNCILSSINVIGSIAV